jgi:hypothetical protein
LFDTDLDAVASALRAVAEGFEPYSATWSEHQKNFDLPKDIAVVHGSYPLVIRICVQSASKGASAAFGHAGLSDPDGRI